MTDIPSPYDPGSKPPRVKHMIDPTASYSDEECRMIGVMGAAAVGILRQHLKTLGEAWKLANTVTLQIVKESMYENAPGFDLPAVDRAWERIADAFRTMEHD